LNSASPEVSTYSVAWVGSEMQRKRQVGVARVHAGTLAGGLAHHVAHRVLDAQRGEVQAAQRRALRVVSTRSVCSA
jgi:hypothetical protein